jgi:hypothetical protein
MEKAVSFLIVKVNWLMEPSDNHFFGSRFSLKTKAKKKPIG